MFDATPDATAPTALAALAPFGTLAGTLHPARYGAAAGTVVIWPSIFSTAAVQADLTGRLATDHDVIAVDPPGHGASRIADAATLTMEAVAAATLALADAAGRQGPLNWVGTSWGGLVGLDAARMAPARLAHLALLNTPFAWDGPGWGKPRVLPLMARLIGRTNTFADGVAKDFFLPATRNGRPDTMAAHRTTFADGDGAQLAAAARLIFGTREDARPHLSGLRVPALVVAGTHDPMYPVAMQRTAAEAIPGAAFEMVESGHISAVDAPGAVERLLRAAWASA